MLATKLVSLPKYSFRILRQASDKTIRDRVSSQADKSSHTVVLDGPEGLLWQSLTRRLSGFLDLNHRFRC